MTIISTKMLARLEFTACFHPREKGLLAQNIRARSPWINLVQDSNKTISSYSVYSPSECSLVSIFAKYSKSAERQPIASRQRQLYISLQFVSLDFIGLSLSRCIRN